MVILDYSDKLIKNNISDNQLNKAKTSTKVKKQHPIKRRDQIRKKKQKTI
jgi:hypothetical protein